jgi:hypothetical protein
VLTAVEQRAYNDEMARWKRLTAEYAAHPERFGPDVRDISGPEWVKEVRGNGEVHWVHNRRDYVREIQPLVKSPPQTGMFRIREYEFQPVHEFNRKALQSRQAAISKRRDSLEKIYAVSKSKGQEGPGKVAPQGQLAAMEHELAGLDKQETLIRSALEKHPEIGKELSGQIGSITRQRRLRPKSEIEALKRAKEQGLVQRIEEGLTSSGQVVRPKFDPGF